MGEARQRYRSLIFDSARWDGFEFRDGDIVIATPAKCGTTWMQMLCALLVFKTADLPAPLTTLSPWVDVQTATLEKVLADLESQQHRRFIKSHTPLDGLPFDERVTYITVGRDPRDMALSWDNHFANMNLEIIIGKRIEVGDLDGLEERMQDLPVPPEDPVDRFWQWMETEAEDVSGLRTSMQVLQTFWDERDLDNVLLFHYSDLKADLAGEMKRLADALRIEIEDAQWPLLVEAATFDQMRDRATELAPQVTDGFWNETGRFFNKGTSGQWRSFFTEADVNRYESRLRAVVSPDLARWVHTGWRGVSA